MWMPWKVTPSILHTQERLISPSPFISLYCLSFCTLPYPFYTHPISIYILCARLYPTLLSQITSTNCHRATHSPANPNGQHHRSTNAKAQSSGSEKIFGRHLWPPLWHRAAWNMNSVSSALNYCLKMLKMYSITVITFLTVDPMVFTFSESFGHIRVSKEKGWRVSWPI